jgi:hypothetical protein
MNALFSGVPAGTELGKTTRHWITGLLAFGLLIFGPLDYDWPVWVRYASLVLLPAASWVVLVAFWRWWRPSREEELRFARGALGVLAGLLFFGSYLAARETSHLECTESVRTRDGEDCVGDYVPAPGPDTFKVFLYAGLGAATFWYSVSSWGPKIPVARSGRRLLSDIETAGLPAGACVRCAHMKDEHWYGGNTTWPCRDCNWCADFLAA